MSSKQSSLGPIASPNPAWKRGDKIDTPFDPDNVLSLPVGDVSWYQMIISACVPRPIALVATVNKQGQRNLAPFSFFQGVAFNPPCVMISLVHRANGDPNDTLRNIIETGEFVVNSFDEWMAEPANFTSGSFPYGTYELEKVGLTAVDCIDVKPHRVRESSLAMECKVINTMDIGHQGKPVNTTLVVGQVQRFHVAKEFYNEEERCMDFDKGYHPVSRLGKVRYGMTRDTFDIPRPKNDEL